MKWKLLFIVFTFSHAMSALANEQLILLVTEHYPPLNYIKAGKPMGSAVEIVQAIQDKLNSNTPIKVYPWKRAYITTTSKKNTAIFAIARSAKREKSFKWVGPIATKSYSFYSLPNNNIQLSSIKDAKNYIIGVQFGSISEEYLQAQQFKNVHSVTNSKQNLRKLLSNRIELWYVDSANLAEQLKLMSVPISRLKKVLTVTNEQLYIGFNTQTSDDIVNLWQNTYQDLYQQGVIKKIYQQHHLLALYPKIKKFIP
ncbi:MAG: transporter substrate-binding domain-containing protein [Alteromonadaceae bacterium]|nr:transporter substrate-binding domain-containing protein [Alteromonadaceae bacterium]